MAQLFTTQTPAQPNFLEGEDWEYGMRFVSDTAGQIQAIRYYKPASETGTHIGRIWSSTGQQLASVTFTNETASGWQQQSLATPLAIQANTSYTVSVNTNQYVAFTSQGFATSVANGGLTAPVSAGVEHANPGAFPTAVYQNNNYFRDMVFSAVAPANQPPDAVNDSGFSTAFQTPLTITAATLLANDTDPNSDPLSITGVSAPVNGSVVLNAQGNPVFTPTAGFSGAASFTYTASDGRGGTDTATVSLTVGAPPSTVSLFTTQTPSQPNSPTGPDWTMNSDALRQRQCRPDRGNPLLQARQRDRHACRPHLVGDGSAAGERHVHQ